MRPDSRVKTLRGCGEPPLQIVIFHLFAGVKKINPVLGKHIPSIYKSMVILTYVPSVQRQGVIHPEYGWIGCSPDGIVDPDSDNSNGVAE